MADFPSKRKTSMSIGCLDLKLFLMESYPQLENFKGGIVIEW